MFIVLPPFVRAARLTIQVAAGSGDSVRASGRQTQERRSPSRWSQALTSLPSLVAFLPQVFGGPLFACEYPQCKYSCCKYSCWNEPVERLQRENDRQQPDRASKIPGEDVAGVVHAEIHPTDADGK